MYWVWPSSEKDNPTISLGYTVNAETVDYSKSSVCFPMAEITAIKLLDVKMLFLEVTASGDNFTKCFGSGGEYPRLSPSLVRHVKRTEKKPPNSGSKDAL